MRRIAPVFVIAMIWSALLPLAVDVQANPPEVIGTFTRLGNSSDLTEERIEETGGGLRLDAPTFASELRVEKAYLDERLPGWAADHAFSVAGGDVVFDGVDVRFDELILDQTPRFTLGSDAVLRFSERPMWVSVEPFEGGVKIEMEDGDSSGQKVMFAREWVRAQGMHRPVATHEDGTPLDVTFDGAYFVIDVPHFSYVLLTPADIDVRGRQDGAVFLHPGAIRWFAADSRLEIDVGLQVAPYDLLVEAEWVDFKIGRPALLGRQWNREYVDGVEFLVTTVSSGSTPATVTYQEFVPNLGMVFSAGSLETIALRAERSMDVTVGGGIIEVTFGAPAPPELFITANGTWLKGLGIERMAIATSVGQITTLTVSAPRWVQFALPANATWLSISHSENLTDPAIGSLDFQMEVGDLCEEFFGTIPAELEYMNVGGNEIALYGYQGTFCWEWNLYDAIADFYNVVGGLWLTGTDTVVCGKGTESNTAVVHKRGRQTCEWKDGDEQVPTSNVEYRILASAWWFEQNDDGVTIASTVECLAAVGGSLVPGVGWLAAGLMVTAGCVHFAVEVGEQIRNPNNGEQIGSEIALLEGQVSDHGARNFVRVEEPQHSSALRVDSWSVADIEYGFLRTPEYDGTMTLCWTMENVDAGQALIDTAYSLVTGAMYDADVVRVIIDPDATGLVATAQAGIPTFDGSACDIRNTEGIHLLLSGSDGVDWETPDAVCGAVARVVASTPLGDEWAEFGPVVGEASGCNGFAALNVLDANGNVQANEPWILFELSNHTLDPAEIIARAGSISVADAEADGWNLTKAIVRKFTTNQTFLDSLDHLEVQTAARSEYCDSISVHEEHRYNFFSEATGYTMFGMPTGHYWNHMVSICFDYLVGLPVELAS